MVDKKLEENIKKTKEFIEIWNKFHSIFKNVITEDHITEGKEMEFLSIKELVSSRYEDLMDSLEVKPLRRFILSPFIYNVLSIDKLSTVSDEKLKVMDKDWVESDKFLSSLFGRLKRKKKRIEGFNKFLFVLKKNMSKFR